MTTEGIICLVAGIVALTVSGLAIFFFTGGERTSEESANAVKTARVMLLIIFGTGAALAALLFALWWFLPQAGLIIASVLCAGLTVGTSAGLIARIIAEFKRAQKSDGGENENE